MYRTLIAFAMALSVGCMGALIVESGSLKDYVYGQGINPAGGNWISHLAEGIALPDYNLYAPYDLQTSGFGDFRVATTAELAIWDGMLDLFLAGSYVAAQASLDGAGMPFQIVQFNDMDTGRTLYMIREIPDTLYVDDNGTEDSYDDERGAFTWGWGIYIHDPAATRSIIVTVPHPCDDFPMPALAVEAFGLWNARFICIAGSGREVRWSNIGSYDNSKSVSDPSRAASHPFNHAYQKFVDRIRLDSGAREWSAQLHSYDWNRHDGYANIQVSAGSQKLCPNLPIRDLSNLKLDLINAGDHLMIPANTVGTHDDVFLNDFYAVNYGVHEFVFDDGIYTYAVNNRIDLPAYSQNRQMLYTLEGWNDYDSFEPFFHSEMDELPSAYVESNDTYQWFYGWDPDLGKWDLANLFTNFLAYYGRCILDLESVLDETLAMDDQLLPTAPGNLAISSHVDDTVTLVWERGSAYDFQTYEVLNSQEPIAAGNYWIQDRNDDPFLASQGCESASISGLLPSTQYFFRLRALDKNGNYSQPSNEVHIYPLAPQITWSPQFFNQTLAPGQTAQQQLVLGNLGDAALEYTCSLPLTSITILEEGFEDAAQLPPGWTQEYLVGTLEWVFASGGVGGHPDGAYEGVLNARLQSSGQSCRTRLISPVLDLSSADSATLTFWHTQAADGNKQDKLKVLNRPSPASAWTELAYYENNIAGWTQETLNLPNPGSSCNLAFEGITGKGFGVCVDDIRVEDRTTSEVEWLSINQSNSVSGMINPGSEVELQLDFNTHGLSVGSHACIVYLATNDPSQPLISLPVELEISNTQPLINLPASISFDMNSVMTVDFSQYIYDPDGQTLGLECLGNNAIQVSISDLQVQFFTIDGWIGTEQIYFTVSDGYSQAIDQVSVSFVQPSQIIPLSSGWNLISSHILPENPSMLEVCSALINNDFLIKVQDEQGNALVPDVNGEWTDYIGPFLNTEGYYLQVQSNCDLVITGSRVQLPLEVALHSGWNIVPFPCRSPQPATLVMQALIDNNLLIKVQDEQGNSIVQDTNGTWQDYIGNFIPGEAYYVKVTNNASVIFHDTLTKVNEDVANPVDHLPHD